MGPSDRFTHVIVILIFGTCYMQVFYLGRAPHTKETLSDFREKCQVTRHSRVFRGLTGIQQTPGFWCVTRSNFLSLHRQVRGRMETLDMKLVLLQRSETEVTRYDSLSPTFQKVEAPLGQKYKTLTQKMFTFQKEG